MVVQISTRTINNNLPNKEHQHYFKEAYFDLIRQTPLVFCVDSLSAFEQRGHCAKMKPLFDSSRVQKRDRARMILGERS